MIAGSLRAASQTRNHIIPPKSLVLGVEDTLSDQFF